MSELKLIKCPACGKEISFNTEACPKCGQPISDEVRDAAIKNQAKNIKNRRIGCLGIIIFIIIYSVYEHFNAPSKMFSFDEPKFMEKYIARLSNINIKNNYGIINITKSEADKNHTYYKLNDNDGELRLYKKDSGKIRAVVIQYDNKNPYNELTIIGAVQSAVLSFFDLGYIPLGGISEIIQKFKQNVMALPRNKRGTVDTDTIRYGITKGEKQIPLITIQIAPCWENVSFEAEEGAIDPR